MTKTSLAGSLLHAASVRAVARVASLLVGLALFACQNDDKHAPTGGLSIVLETDLSVPMDIDRIQLAVTRAGKPLLAQDQEVGAGHLLLPAKFFVPSDGDSAPVLARGIAFKDGAPRIERSATTPIPNGRVGVVHLALNYLCDGTADANGQSTCGDGNTCVGGNCVTSTIPASDVPTSDTAADGGTAPDAQCFDVLACFGGASVLPLDRASCSVNLPAGTDPSKVNVALELPVGGEGICDAAACWVALAEGPDGWTLDGNRVLLPHHLCAASVTATPDVAVSVLCGSLAPNTPTCGSWSSAPTPIESPPPPTGTDACAGAKTEACGQCGSRNRTCTNGTWSDWSACAGEGVCATGDTQSCGAGGTQVCGADCAWAACAGQGCDGPTTSACGQCGTQTRTCQNGIFSDWTPCTGEGECAPGASATCDTGGVHSCGGDCHFGACMDLACSGSSAQACDKCGTQTRTCDSNTGDWSAWSSCGGGGECNANDTRACGSNGTQTCGGDCTWSTTCDGQTCSGAATGTCGKCGTQARACDNGTWSAWSACSGEGACAAPATQACGTHGSQSCTDSCQWDTCVCDAGYTLCGSDCVNLKTEAGHCGTCTTTCTGTCQNGSCSCDGSSSQTCGKCGSQSRTCSNGTWSAFGACTGEGACAVGTTQSCGTGGTETCSNSCQWGSCACPAGQTLCGSACVDETKDANNCGACGTKCDGTCVSKQCQTTPLLASGFYHNCALRSDGVLKCWGANSYGQLGNGTKTQSATPVTAQALTGIKALTAGFAHTCALLSSGAVYCWGYNSYGQIGNGSTTDVSTPTQVSGISTATAISAGEYSTCALLANGTVACWGDNGDGELGNGSLTSSSLPVTVSNLSGVSAIAMGYYHACAIISGGVRCWGSNHYGNLGDGTGTSSSVPVVATGVSGAAHLAAGYDATCALLTGGTVTCWGLDDFGELGSTVSTQIQYSPARSTAGAIANFSSIASISMGNSFACALDTTGNSYCWGHGQAGELGNGGTAETSVPTATSQQEYCSVITTGDEHTCALTKTGKVWCWGQNGYGQLGPSNVSVANSPVQVLPL